MDGVRFEVALWDTGAKDGYDRLRPLSYQDTHVFCICFCIDIPETLDEVHERVSSATLPVLSL